MFLPLLLKEKNGGQKCWESNLVVAAIILWNTVYLAEAVVYFEVILGSDTALVNDELTWIKSFPVRA
jgi:hypothetical protein